MNEEFGPTHQIRPREHLVKDNQERKVWVLGSTNFKPSLQIQNALKKSWRALRKYRKAVVIRSAWALLLLFTGSPDLT